MDRLPLWDDQDPGCKARAGASNMTRYSYLKPRKEHRQPKVAPSKWSVVRVVRVVRVVQKRSMSVNIMLGDDTLEIENPLLPAVSMEQMQQDHHLPLLFLPPTFYRPNFLNSKYLKGGYAMHVNAIAIHAPMSPPYPPT